MIEYENSRLGVEPLREDDLLLVTAGKAKAQGIEGPVRLQAILDKDGKVANLVVLSGDPMLATAALDAVRQWQYSTTLLNGDPVEVVTQIDVNFTLAK